MVTPPLQLERSVLERLLVERDSSYAAGTPQQPRGRWQLKLEQSADRPELWRVALELRFEPTEENPGPYRIEATMIGFFRLPNGLAKEEAAKLAGITGASILYSAAREQILMVTGRMMWGPFQLPTVRFPSPEEAVRSQEVPTAAAASSKKPPGRRRASKVTATKQRSTKRRKKH